MTNRINVLAILPARIGSTRLPRKPLLDLGGKPVIVRTFEGIQSLFEHIVVATDDAEIESVCKEYEVPCIMTSTEHSNGTSRCLEAMEAYGQEFDYIINVQGDEAFIEPSIVEPLLELLQTKKPQAATLKAPLPAYHSNSNVFVVTDKNHKALMFSRNPLPFNRDGIKIQRYQHVGIYAYTPKALKLYCSLEPTPLEKAESLEQLRWMEHGKHWLVAESPKKPISIDTPSDYEAAKMYFK